VQRAAEHVNPIAGSAAYAPVDASVNAPVPASVTASATTPVTEVIAERHPATRVRIDLEKLRNNRGVLPQDSGPASLAYRMLRTQVLQRVRLHGVRALGVVSAVDGEGKSLTAMNLAFGIAAELNQNVLLVDLDLRRPSIAKLLGLPVDQGLEGWFAGVVSIGDLCRGIEGIDRLEVIPTLAPVPNSSELLSSRRSQEMIRDLKIAQRDGLVIFDLPPVLLTDDFLTIAPLLDGVVLVASEGITKRDDLTRTLELVSSVRLVGTVLNRASESEKRAY
jgi:Mrp family chromosome partitioning ATPase